MRIRKNNIVAFLLIILNPVLGYIFNLLSTLRYKLDNFKILLISFSSGIFGYAFNPFTYSDNFRYFKIYSFSTETVNLAINSDIFLNIVSAVCYKLNLDFFWNQFIFVFLSYIFLLNSFKKSVNKDVSTKDYILYFILYYLSISFNDSVDGMRDYLAISISIYGYILIFKFNKKKGYIILLLSTLVHYMTWIFLLTLILKKFINKRYLKTILILSIFLGKWIIMPNIFLKLVKRYHYLIPNSIYSKMLIYFDSAFMNNLKSNVSQAGLIYTQILFIVTVLIPVVYLLKQKKIDSYQSIILLNYSIVFLLQNFETISYRVSIICLPMLILDIISQKIIYLKKIILLYIGTFLFFLIQIFSYRKVFFYSYKKILFKNLIQIILVDENKREFVGENKIFYRKDFQDE